MNNTVLFLVILAFALLAVWVLVTHDYEDTPDDQRRRMKDWLDERRRDDR